MEVEHNQKITEVDHTNNQEQQLNSQLQPNILQVQSALKPNKFRLYQMKYSKNIKQQKFDKKVYYRFLTQFIQQKNSNLIETKDGFIKLPQLYTGSTLTKGDYLIALVNRVSQSQSQGTIIKTDDPDGFLRMMYQIQNRNNQKQQINKRKQKNSAKIFQRW